MNDKFFDTLHDKDDYLIFINILVFILITVTNFYDNIKIKNEKLNKSKN